MRELAVEYRKSLKALGGRINLLTRQKEFLERRCKEPEKNSDIIALNDRLKLLRVMYKYLSEVTREVANYYKRGWWRSEKYTFNQRKSRS